MKDLIDLHTHTLASGHAYNTIKEMAAAGKEKGLSILGISEHAPQMPGSCNEMYFNNLKSINKTAYGIPLLFGSELNILDKKGSVDLSERTMQNLDYCIASLHLPCIDFMGQKDCTSAIIGAIENPYVTIIGHPDDGRYPLNYDEVAAAAFENHVLLEINNSSLSPNGFRLNSRENYLEMLSMCKKYGTTIIMDSDAHIDTQVGNHCYALSVIEECNFPKEQIVNTDLLLLKKFIPAVSDFFTYTIV